MDSEEDLKRWVMLSINQAQSIERLDLIAKSLKQDSADGETYTKNADDMALYRKLWQERKQQLTKEKSNAS